MRPLHRHPYTFIEMLVVCVIVLLITALVAPRLGGGTKRKTDGCLKREGERCQCQNRIRTRA